METVYLGVGSNLEPETNVPAAVERLAAVLALTGVSTFYRTAPLEGRVQPDYWNGVVAGQTRLEPPVLKASLVAIENGLGRQRTGDRYASRTLDLDLLLCGDRVIDRPGLRLPDPDLRVRPFLAWPLLELAPDLVLPDTGERLADVAARLPRAGMTPLPEVTAALRARVSASPP
jgi:2-amino-4-hydroxy-6-hydroxymethyldihydropteridine diphosphokinase